MEITFTYIPIYLDNDSTFITMPGYWRNETSGVLCPAVESYLAGSVMDNSHIAAMRAYIRHWIDNPIWKGDGIPELRAGVNTIVDRASLERWLRDAELIGIDPI